MCRLKEFIKEQLVGIPINHPRAHTPPAPAQALAPAPAPAPPAPPVAQPSTPASSLTDPGAMLAGLL